MSTEERVATLEVDMNEVKTLLAGAARRAENAAAVADRNEIVFQDSCLDTALPASRDNVRSLVAGVDRLETIVVNHLKREHGQGEQEET